MNWIDIIGYTASVLIALSLTMNNIWRLRWISLFGSAAMILYGALICSYPVIGLNTFIFGVNIFYLYQIWRQEDYFTFLEVTPQNSAFLPKFLDFYRDDINAHFPDFDWAQLQDSKIYFILRNMVSVGLFVYEKYPDGIINIKLDYVIPNYRDLKNAHFAFRAQRDIVHEKGYRRLMARSATRVHQKYLRQMGFKPDAHDPTLFWKANER